MININKQKGIGMVEILVALLLLAVGVLGFVALQLRAVDATTEALNKVQAMNLARDLAERIRFNRDGLPTYIEQINSAATQASSVTDANKCFGASDAAKCDSKKMAVYDSAEIVKKAIDSGLSVRLPYCEGMQTPDSRVCVYVAWGKTKITKDDVAECMASGAYKPSAQCIVLEAY
jgi:type IV pilus assembly protein PilV